MNAIAMNDGLDDSESLFDHEEKLLETQEATTRRAFVRNVLGVQPTDDVLSVGCGLGFEPAELAESVGTDGTIVGIDTSESIVSAARKRCRDYSNTDIVQSEPTEIPADDDRFDSAVATQVYRSVDTLGPALGELRRVLRPGGRAAIYETDFDSLVWRSSNPDRMDQVIERVDQLCPQPALGSRLGPELQDAGFVLERVEPYTICNIRLQEGTFSYHFMYALENTLVERGLLEPAEASAWVEELLDLEDAGETFFSLTQHCYVVRVDTLGLAE